MTAVRTTFNLGLMPRPQPSNPAPEKKPVQAFERLTPERSSQLLGTCASVLDKSKEFISFVDEDRKRARWLGVETIAFELSGLMEDGVIDGLMGSLRESVNGATVNHVSPETLGRLRHAESILSDASRRIGKEIGQEKSGGLGMVWLPFAVIAAAAVGVVLLVSKPKPPSSIDSITRPGAKPRKIAPRSPEPLVSAKPQG